MTNQKTLFDLDEGKRRKDEAMAKLAEAYPKEIRMARTVAAQMAHVHGSVTADDVREELERRGVEWGNWAGAIFKHPMFAFTGEFRASTVAERKGGMIRVWRLK